MPDNDPSAVAAREALELAGHARRTAGARPSAPAWYAPARGLLFALAFGLLGGPWNGEPLILVAGIAAMVAFLAVHGKAIRRGGVISMPGGPVGRRVLAQAVPAAVYGLGWLAAIPLRLAGGALAAAVLGGAALWFVTARQEAGAARP